ncbi:MAG: glycosyltransferase family 1 protein [Candidatus Promineifilaceae bacterium]
MWYVDVSAAAHSRAGLGRYSENMARALADARPGQVALFHNLGKGGKRPDSLRHLPTRQVNWGYKPWRMAVWLAHLSGIAFDRLVPDATLFHSTEHLLMPLHTVPTVLTVHDLIFKLFPEHHKKLNYYYLNLAMPLFCRRATAIVAVSQATKRDVVKHYGVDAAKIHVVHEAPAVHFSPPPPAKTTHVRQEYDLPDRYLIHLGTIEPRKNLLRLLDSLQTLRQTFPSLSLVLAGGKGWLYDDFFAKIKALGLQKAVRVLGWVPDEDLPAVLAAADLAVQPSLYEGFGLPLLEHMACGQVVAASNSSSHPEVGGNAAAYFDPTHTEEMTVTIRRLLTDRDEYAHRRQLGLEHVRHFTWQRAAAETIAVYEQLLQYNVKT